MGWPGGGEQLQGQPAAREGEMAAYLMSGPGQRHHDACQFARLHSS